MPLVLKDRERPFASLVLRLAPITIALSFIVTGLFLTPETARAQSSSLPAPKTLKEGASGAKGSGFDFGFGSALDIMDSTQPGLIYDAPTLATLKRLSEDCQPAWEPDLVDQERNRRAAGRVLAIQGGRGVTSVLNSSDLRSTYQWIRQGISSFQETFRYSLQSNANGLEVSRNPKGRKLLELNVEINLKQGLDPQIKLGESVRFRYDYIEQRPILEYGIKF